MKVTFEGDEFWKNYMINWFGEALIEKWETSANIVAIDSVNGPINSEVYHTGNPDNPTLVFTHGIAGYARILLPFLIPLFERGINIIAPDLEGYGYNRRKKGDFTWDIHLSNLNDAVAYARTVFTGKVFLGGASMGGPLAYATDARYDCADGLICWCLWDFADREFMEKETNTKKMTYLLIPLMNLAAKLAGNLRLKTIRLVSYDTLTADQAFNDLVKIDPQAGTLISLRGACSLVTRSKPDVGHEWYDKPVLVCQPEEDDMTPSHYTKKTFQKLKSRTKRYVGFAGAHFPLEQEAYERWAKEAAGFAKENG